LKKIVAVSQRVDIHPNRNEKRDALDHELCNWINEAGYLTVPVPNMLGQDKLLLWLKRLQPSAIILSGGNNIGEEKNRDKTEVELLNFAQQFSLPLLGICRGMQMIGIWAGGALKNVEGHIGSSHLLYGEIVGEVNSYHNFSLCECPSSFEVIAVDENNYIEAIRHQTLPWEGWMWHPEREKVFQINHIQRLRNLFGK